MKGLNRRCAVRCLSALWLMLLGSWTAVEAAEVRLTWNPNPETFVAGYYVYVTRFPLQTVQFDTGPTTAFTYPDVEPGAGYFFSVAAYTAGGLVGPRSEFVFYLTGSAIVPSAIGTTTSTAIAFTAPWETAAPTPAPDPSRSSPVLPDWTGSGPLFCDETSGNGSSCLQGQVLTSTAHRITALAPVSESRVAIVEDAVRIRFIGSGQTPAADAALAVEPSEEIVGIAVDPDFEKTRTIFVGITERDPNGLRRLSLVRYREVNGTLGQRAVVVNRLSVPADGAIPLTIDAQGRLYVSLEGRSVLRFEPDGRSSPMNDLTSPIVIQGGSRVTALAWNAATSALWLAGNDSHSLEYIAALAPNSTTGFAVESAEGRLLRLAVHGEQVSLVPLKLPAGLVATLVAHRDALDYTVVHDSAHDTDLLIQLITP